jgi:hypothetical protein
VKRGDLSESFVPVYPLRAARARRLHWLQVAEERRLVEAAGRDGRRLLSITSLCVPPAR